ncbi:hypothetical protein [Streptomyces rochei]|uniref:hypothetical protein n=1 Tax=Streptomyces rochei TaxID=1928 RepID=UPI0013BC2B2C|nr:hypothetical protein [Streptomyces rochei]NEC77229.1 hypothetical protein [Streptomyces rochei]
MPDRITIDLAALWSRHFPEPGALRAAQRWLRLNQIDPSDVPVRSSLVLEDSAFGPVIRYDAFVTTDEDRRLIDAAYGDQPVTRRRTALLWQEPPLEWLTFTDGDR